MYEFDWDVIKEDPKILTKLLNKHNGARSLARLCGIAHTSVLKRTNKFDIEFDRDLNEWVNLSSAPENFGGEKENKNDQEEDYIWVNEHEEEAEEDLIKEGEEESKPRYEYADDVYTVYYGKKSRYSVSISKYDLEEALSLYCVARLTLNQVSLKMGLTRKEFYAIKTAFDITKDSLPFTPEQLDKFTADELAEKYRVKKKQYSLQKYEMNKYADIEKRVKEMDEGRFWYNELCQTVNRIEPEIYFTPTEIKNFGARKGNSNSSDVYIIYNTDVHSGLKVDNYFNTYNLDIMHSRFKILTENIIKRVPVGHIYITDLGDSVHGIIHGSVKRYSSWAIKSTSEVIKAYESMFLTLAKNGYTITFTKVNGSHGSLDSAKTDRTEEENLGHFIFDMLEWKYSSFSEIKFIPKLKGLNVAIVPIFNYSTALIHGDETSLKSIKDIGYLFKEHNVREVNAGHFHHRKVEDFNDLSIYFNECFCGTDQYAGNKFLSSGFGTRIVQYSPIGRESEFLVRY